jgi:hypothetical protein
VQLDEAVGGSDRLLRLFVAVVSVGHLDLRLLGETAERVARHQLLVELDRVLVVALVEVLFRFVIELRSGPVGGLVFLVGQQAATGQKQHEKDRDQPVAAHDRIARMSALVAGDRVYRIARGVRRRAAS